MTDILMRVADLATRQVGNGAFAGITVAQNGTPETHVFTDPRSPLVDQVQYDTDAGPCLDAFRSGKVFGIHDSAVEPRWRAFCDAALDQSIRSTLSVPLDVSGNRTEVLGALNLYSEKPDAFDDEAVAAIESLAQQAAIIIANAQAFWGAKLESEHLQQAMESRAVIEQAKGILMAQSGVSPDEAFQLLVRASQRENRKLRLIASDLVERTQQRGANGKRAS